MRATPMTDNYEKHELVSRELEKVFGLRTERSVLGKNRAKGNRPTRRPKTWESFRGQKSGIDVRELTRTVTELYRSSPNGAEFAERLAGSGCALVRGKHAEFCIRDSAGHLHSLLRRLDGVSASKLRTFMKDVDPDRLPVA